MRRRTLAALALCAPFLPRAAQAEMEPLPPPPIVISAARADLWAALVTPAGIAATDGGKAIVDLRSGGSIRRHPDAHAAADAPGWTESTVLAFVAPRLLLLADAAPSTWTAIDLDALDPLRTRVRFEHVGVVPGSNAEATAESADAECVARLRKRFPDRPDPVLAALQPMAGTWEERPYKGGDLLARWKIVVSQAEGPGDPEKSTSVTLERKAVVGEDVECWVFWREAESGRWIGGRVEGGRLAAWEIVGFANGGFEWFDRWGEVSPSYSIAVPPRDGAVEAWESQGCTCHEGYRWTRISAPK